MQDKCDKDGEKFEKKNKRERYSKDIGILVIDICVS